LLRWPERHQLFFAVQDRAIPRALPSDSATIRPGRRARAGQPDCSADFLAAVFSATTARARGNALRLARQSDSAGHRDKDARRDWSNYTYSTLPILGDRRAGGVEGARRI